jgi:hypothetical protein
MTISKNTEPTIQALPNSQIPGFSPIYRKTGIEHLDYRPSNDITTIRDLFTITAKRHQNRTAISITSPIKVTSRF